MRIAAYLMILIVTSCLAVSVSAFPTAGDSNDYFDYTYKVELSRTQVQIQESFSAHICYEGTCKQSLPVTIDKAIISGKIIARLQGSSLEVGLNAGFSMQIDSISGQAGASFKKDVEVPLFFPAGSPPGKYDVIARTTGAQFQVLGFLVDGLSYIPADPVTIGTIECIISQPFASQNTNTVVPHPDRPELVVERGNIFWPVIGGASGFIIVCGLISWHLLRPSRKRNV